MKMKGFFLLCFIAGCVSLVFGDENKHWVRRKVIVQHERSFLFEHDIAFVDTRMHSVLLIGFYIVQLFGK